MADFTPSHGGAFLRRDGPAGGVRGRCPHKLCLATTDQEYLRNVLLDLSRDPHCCFVKYSAQSKEGIFLGRCVMNSEDRVGRLWRRLRSDPKLLCNVQDDDFVERFRG